MLWADTGSDDTAGRRAVPAVLELVFDSTTLGMGMLGPVVRAPDCNGCDAVDCEIGCGTGCEGG